MTYQFEADGMWLGNYYGESLQKAKEAAAKDWGYSSWKDMVQQAHEMSGYSNIQIYDEHGVLIENGQ